MISFVLLFSVAFAAATLPTQAQCTFENANWDATAQKCTCTTGSLIKWSSNNPPFMCGQCSDVQIYYPEELTCRDKTEQDTACEKLGTTVAEIKNAKCECKTTGQYVIRSGAEGSYTYQCKACDAATPVYDNWACRAKTAEELVCDAVTTNDAKMDQGICQCNDNNKKLIKDGKDANGKDKYKCGTCPTDKPVYDNRECKELNAEQKAQKEACDKLGADKAKFESDYRCLCNNYAEGYVVIRSGSAGSYTYDCKKCEGNTPAYDQTNMACRAATAKETCGTVEIQGASISWAVNGDYCYCGDSAAEGGYVVKDGNKYKCDKCEGKKWKDFECKSDGVNGLFLLLAMALFFLF